MSPARPLYIKGQTLWRPPCGILEEFLIAKNEQKTSKSWSKSASLGVQKFDYTFLFYHSTFKWLDIVIVSQPLISYYALPFPFPVYGIRIPRPNLQAQ